MSRAQFGIESLFSYLTFAVFLIFVLLVLNIGGCASGQQRAEMVVEKNLEVLDDVRASAQLSAYLRTPMPGFQDLKSGITGLGGKGRLGSDADFDADAAVAFLEGNPDVYTDVTYGEFISALYSHCGTEECGELQNVFNAVTRGMFHRHLFAKGVREANDGRLDGIYTSPVIGVTFGGHQRAYYEVGGWLSAPPLASTAAGIGAVQTLPTYDGKGVSVRLAMSRQLDRDGRPQP